MTFKITSLAVMLALASTMVSCLNGNNDAVYYDDAAIVSLKLGKVNCTKTIRNYNDTADSTYTYSYSAAGYSVYIDQVGKRIYNPEPLAYGTNMKKVLLTISTTRNAQVFIKDINEDKYSYYSSTDSVDLSVERIFRVVATDGEHYKDYKIGISVQPEMPDQYSWEALTVNNDKIALFTKMKTVWHNGMVCLLGTDDSGDVTLMTSTDGLLWVEKILPVTTTVGGASLVSHDGTLYLLSDDKLYTSANGSMWSKTGHDAVLAAMVGGCQNELYALNTDGMLMVSTDRGATWTEDGYGKTEYVDNKAYMPVSDISAVTSAAITNKEVGRITLIGNAAGISQTDAVVWNKYVDADSPQEWCYTAFSGDNSANRLYNMKNLSATGYADGIIAIGGESGITGESAYKEMYYSPDHGLTWHRDKTMALPDTFTANTTVTASIVADGKGYFYLVGSQKTADGKRVGVVYRARQNKQTWPSTDNQYYYQ